MSKTNENKNTASSDGEEVYTPEEIRLLDKFHALTKNTLDVKA
jgi:hypothetical protein